MRRRPARRQVPSREAATPNCRGMTATNCGVAHLFVMRMAARSSHGPAHQTDEASRPDQANQLTGSSGVLCSLRPHHRLSVVLRLSEPAPGLAIGAQHLGSIPGPKPSRSWPTIQVLFFASGM